MLVSPDAALIERTLAGDQVAFAQLVGRHHAAVWRTVRRTLANYADREDAVQEVFLRAFTALGSFDRTLPFRPWIVRIATNYCVDELRRRRARDQLWTELGEEELERALTSLTLNGDFDSRFLQSPETYERIAAALLDELHPKYRVAFVLRELEGKSYSDVAQAMGTSELTARVRVARARKMILKKFKAYLSRSGKDE
jgi:RNA polymerase sigma-70 factor, ECF subfamily